LNGAGGIPDFVATLSSMSTGATSNFVLNWTDAPSSAIKVHYLALGGSDLTGARCGSYAVTALANTDNVTVNTGFGQPDLLFFANIGVTALGDTNSTGRVHIGFASSATDRRAGGFWGNDAATTMNVSQVQKQRAIYSLGAVGSFEGESELSARGSWPTDGFQLDHSSNTYSVAHVFLYLALKGTFQVLTGVNTAPTAGGLPVVQDNAVGFAPSGAIFFGWSGTAAATIDSTGADVLGWFFGATDGTNEGLSAITQDDANTTSFAGNVHSETKSVANYIAGTLGTDPPSLQSEADGSFSGNNVRLSWNDIDTVAREYVWVAFGGTAAAAANTAGPRVTLQAVNRAGSF
jgi:hypothetical protein